jgi:hypothetical protein
LVHDIKVILLECCVLIRQLTTSNCRATEIRLALTNLPNVTNEHTRTHLIMGNGYSVQAN